MSETKPTNPKDLIGCNKVPFHLWPETATIYGAMALLDGALKYGRTNWRSAGVKASIYYDACRRHLNAWFEGTEYDSDSSLPHLAHALACIAILIDATEAEKLVDDRMFPGGYQNCLKDLTEYVVNLKTKHADKNPKHFTIETDRQLPTPVFPKFNSSPEPRSLGDFIAKELKPSEEVRTEMVVDILNRYEKWREQR